MSARDVSDPDFRLFYSYAHEDEELQEQVKTHLAALVRAGLIGGWDDRMITAGSDWEGEIEEALERADVILLLISPDFISSDYCWDVEMKRALVRHRASEALVVPIILRDCLWHDAPFSALQCLPSGGRPIVSWDPRDGGYLDVARGLRRAISARAEALARTRPPRTATEARSLDAAIARTVPVARAVDVVAMVRTSDSGGLRAILEVEPDYSAEPEDVRAEPFELTFPETPSGQLEAAEVVLRLEGGDFDPPLQEKTIEVPPDGDSNTCVFLVTARREGPLLLNLELQHNGVSLVQQLLRTNASASVERRSVQPYRVASTDYGGDRDRGDVPPPAPAPPPMAPGGGGACFVATAAYGTSFDPSVAYLRDFRDVVLLKGRARRLSEGLLRVYYRVAPPIARAMLHVRALKYLVRYGLIWPLVSVLRLGERFGWFSVGMVGERDPVADMDSR